MRQRQKLLNFKGFEYEIWHHIPRGYFATGRGKTSGEIALSFFDKFDQAQEHAELEIQGYIHEEQAK